MCTVAGYWLERPLGSVECARSRGRVSAMMAQPQARLPCNPPQTLMGFPEIHRNWAALSYFRVSRNIFFVNRNLSHHFCFNVLLMMNMEYHFHPSFLSFEKITYKKEVCSFWRRKKLSVSLLGRTCEWVVIAFTCKVTDCSRVTPLTVSTVTLSDATRLSPRSSTTSRKHPARGMMSVWNKNMFQVLFDGLTIVNMK